jgi:hypothetical protein
MNAMPKMQDPIVPVPRDMLAREIGEAWDTLEDARHGIAAKLEIGRKAMITLWRKLKEGRDQFPLDLAGERVKGKRGSEGSTSGNELFAQWLDDNDLRKIPKDARYQLLAMANHEDIAFPALQQSPHLSIYVLYNREILPRLAAQGIRDGSNTCRRGPKIPLKYQAVFGSAGSRAKILEAEKHNPGVLLLLDQRLKTRAFPGVVNAVNQPHKGQANARLIWPELPEIKHHRKWQIWNYNCLNPRHLPALEAINKAFTPHIDKWIACDWEGFDDFIKKTVSGAKAAPKPAQKPVVAMPVRRVKEQPADNLVPIKVGNKQIWPRTGDVNFTYDYDQACAAYHWFVELKNALHLARQYESGADCALAIRAIVKWPARYIARTYTGDAYNRLNNFTLLVCAMADALKDVEKAGDHSICHGPQPPKHENDWGIK